MTRVDTVVVVVAVVAQTTRSDAVAVPIMIDAEGLGDAQLSEVQTAFVHVDAVEVVRAIVCVKAEPGAKPFFNVGFNKQAEAGSALLIAHTGLTDLTKLFSILLAVVAVHVTSQVGAVVSRRVGTAISD